MRIHAKKRFDKLPLARISRRKFQKRSRHTRFDEREEIQRR